MGRLTLKQASAQRTTTPIDPTPAPPPPVKEEPVEESPRGWRSLLSRSKSKQTVDQVDPWTQGRKLSTRAVTYGVWGGLLLWPVVAAIAVLSMLAPAAAPPPPPAPANLTAQAAGPVAEDYVSAWLSASTKDYEGLNRYFPNAGSLPLPAAGVEHRNVTYGPIEVEGDDVRVVVAAQVRESVKDSDGAVRPVWRQRFWTVTTRDADGVVHPVGLPRATTSPVGETQGRTGYTSNLPASSAPAEAVTGFLQAYTTDTGDITRFISPGSQITAITPAPATSVRITQFWSDGQVPESAPDGATLRVMARAVLVVDAEHQTTGDYTVELTARAGRWEVSTLDPAASTTSMASPSVPLSTPATPNP